MGDGAVTVPGAVQSQWLADAPKWQTAETPPPSKAKHKGSFLFLTECPMPEAVSHLWLGHATTS
jgi:hypothetical protein